MDEREGLVRGQGGRGRAARAGPGPGDPGGRAGGICAAARAYPLAGSKKIDLDKALGYFENNAPRMRGKWFRSRGLFVSSGAVEAGCKAVRQRLKLSGRRWTVAGAGAITALRCRDASSQRETICHAPHNQTAAA